MKNNNGKWKRWDSMDCDIWDCSECGFSFSFDEGGPYENEAYFCPRCGTRMIEVKDDKRK